MQLFTDFPEISTAQWEEKIIKDLKGADYQKKLIWNTDEGIPVKPYYRKEDLESLSYLKNAGQLKAGGESPNQWTVCQDIFPGKNINEANAKIISALHGGAEAIRIHLDNVPSAGADLINELLDGVPLAETEIIFCGSMMADAIYDFLSDLAKKGGSSVALLKGSPGADPLGKMISSGYPIASLENLGKLVRKISENSPRMRAITVKGDLFQNSGSTLVEELAFTLSMANEYMATLSAQGIDPQVAASSLQINLSAGSNYFMEVAKLRAARILWGKICEGYGLIPADAKLKIHTTSSEWNMTLYDPHANMLRGTTEAMSAIIGGSDLVSVLPFDYPYGKSSEFSDRIARNIQIILREEAYFDRVADPASGSYYIESLTDSLGELSWDLFKKIESKGGFRKTFESGWIQEKVIASKNKKLERANSGRDRILGTNAFPNFNEMVAESVSVNDSSKESDTPLKALTPFRLSSLFEEIRLATEKSSKRPKVLLSKFGDPAWMTARAMFSGNFFACAGYEIIDQPAPGSIAEGIENARKTDADIVVLCSSDDDYAEAAPRFQQALGEHSIVVVAGYPKEHMENLKASGISHFIHMRSHLLETLKEFNKLLV